MAFDIKASAKEKGIAGSSLFLLGAVLLVAAFVLGLFSSNGTYAQIISTAFFVGTLVVMAFGLVVIGLVLYLVALGGISDAVSEGKVFWYGFAGFVFDVIAIIAISVALFGFTGALAGNVLGNISGLAGFYSGTGYVSLTGSFVGLTGGLALAFALVGIFIIVGGLLYMFALVRAAAETKVHAFKFAGISVFIASLCFGIPSLVLLNLNAEASIVISGIGYLLLILSAIFSVVAFHKLK